MIINIGIDIIEKKRIKNIIKKYNKNIIKKILSDKEINNYNIKKKKKKNSEIKKKKITK